MPSRKLFYAESLLTGFFGLFCVLTLVWRDWLEKVIGVDPDHHNGDTEWAIVLGFAVAAVVCGVLARRQWRRLARVT